jgi:hypothetical protein
VDEYLKNVSTRTGRDGCEYCHSFDGWQTVNFDHQQTGFPLNGRHSQVSCSQCHQPVMKNNLLEKIIFKNTVQQCTGCHQDVHQGQFQTDSTEQVLCQRCHQPEGWQQLVFNHNRDARFTLQGAHQTVTCNQCHPLVIQNNRKFVRYKPLDTSCKACHGTEKIQNKLN